MSSPAFQGAESDMNDTLTPQEAARALAKAASWETALRSRTEGITWMVWALVTPAIFLTYSFVSVVAGNGWWMAFLWAPWVFVGALTTAILWRTAALAHPPLDPHRGRRTAMAWGMGSGALLFVAFLVIRPDSSLYPLAGIGLMWAAMGLFNPYGATGEGRIVSGLTGGSLVLLAIALGLMRLPEDVSGTISILASGAVPLAAGVWHATRA